MPRAMVVAAVFIVTMGNAMLYAIVGPFVRDAGLTEFHAGVVFSLSAVLFFLGSPIWGRLADRWGRRPVIMAGLIGAAVSFLLFAAVFSIGGNSGIDSVSVFVALLAARAIYGVLSCGVQPAAVAYMADITSHANRSAGAAVVGAWVGLASIAGPAGAALLVGFGFAVPLLGAGALAVLAAALSFVFLHDVSRTSSGATVAGHAPGGSMTPYVIVAVATYLALSVLQPTTAFYIQDVFDLDAALAARHAGVASTIFAASAFVVQAWAVPAFRFTPRTLLLMGPPVCLLGIAGWLLAPNLALLFVALGMFGVGFGLTQPGLMAGASLAAGKDKQGVAAGYLQAAGAGAWILGPLVGTALYPLALRGPLYLAAAMMVLGSLGFLRRRD